jgi:hypothetical protein
MALSGEIFPELATSNNQGPNDGTSSTAMTQLLPLTESAEDSSRYLLSPSSNHGESIAAGIPPEESMREHADDATLASDPRVGLLKKRYIHIFK